MKTLFTLLSLCFTLTLTAQTAPPIKGIMYDSGPLLLRGEVAGHYRVSSPEGKDAKKRSYVITLMDTDLQPLTTVTYNDGEEYDFEAIAWNGIHYGLVYRVGRKERDRVRYFEGLDEAGQRVWHQELPRKTDVRCHVLKPIGEGFILGEIFTDYGNTRFMLSRRARDGRQSVWQYTGGGSTGGDMTTCRLLSTDEDRLLVEVRRTRTYSEKYWRDLYCFDARTGKVRYKEEQADHARGWNIRPYLDGMLTADGAIIAQHIPGPRDDKYRYGFELRRLNAAGEQTAAHRFYDQELFRQALLDNNLPAVPDNAYAVRTGIEINPRGVVTLAFEVMTKIDLPETRFNDYGYGDAYVLVINPDFSVGQMLRVKRKGFVLSETEAAGVTITEINAINRKMSKENYEKLNVRQLVTLQNGPFSTSLTTTGPGNTSFTFFDRVIHKGGVDYHGVDVVTYHNGSLRHDHISLRDQPDLVYVSRSTAGSIKLRSHKYGEGSEAWLEKLSF